MKKMILVNLLLATCLLVVGQKSADKISKWYLKPAGGINIPITSLFKGEVTDNLFEYDDHSYYWQVISADFYFHKNWGLEFTYQGSSSKNIAGRAARFDSEMTERYSDDYYVKPTSSALFGESSTWIGGNIEKGYLGIVYRIEKPRLLFLYKLFIGVTSFRTDWAGVILKEKGTNTIIEIQYDTGKRPNDHFTIAPGFTFGYRLSKRFVVNAVILYSFFKTDIAFTEVTRNKYTGETIYSTTNYTKDIHILSIGLGIIIELKPVF